MTMHTAISLRQLDYLLAVADHGSMTAAAEASHVSQASISLSINELERRLGAQLLRRHPGQGVSLTDAGQSAVREARRVLDAVHDLYASAQAPTQQVRGRVTFGCFSTLAPFYVPALLSSFATLHPALQLEVHEGSQGEIRRSLADGSCAVALTYDSDLGSGVARSPIMTNRPQIVLPEAHPLATQPEVRLEDLADERLILLSLEPTPTNTAPLFRDRGLEMEVYFSSPNIELVRAMVAHGLGYTILVQNWPVSVSIDGLPVIARPIVGDVPEFRVVVAWNKNHQLSARSKAVIKGLRQLTADRRDDVAQLSE